MFKTKKKFNRRKIRNRFRVYMSSKGRIRLCIFRSNLNIYAQLIDDSKRMVIASSSTLEKSFNQELHSKATIKTSRCVGILISKKAKILGIKKVVLDRGAYIYHGCVKALADSARADGLEF